MARYRITKDIKSITIRVAFLIVREPMAFLKKPLTEPLTPWKVNRVETLIALHELKKLLDKDWFIERMEMARIKLEEHNLLIKSGMKQNTKDNDEEEISKENPEGEIRY